MTPDTLGSIRTLYNIACHGAGAEARWQARDRLQAIADREGRKLIPMLDDLGLDVDAFFASRPISR